jgi:hypothetical protein
MYPVNCAGTNRGPCDNSHLAVVFLGGAHFSGFEVSALIAGCKESTDMIIECMCIESLSAQFHCNIFSFYLTEHGSVEDSWNYIGAV